MVTVATAKESMFVCPVQARVFFLICVPVPPLGLVWAAVEHIVMCNKHHHAVIVEAICKNK